MLNNLKLTYPSLETYLIILNKWVQHISSSDKMFPLSTHSLWPSRHEFYNPTGEQRYFIQLSGLSTIKVKSTFVIKTSA